MDAGEEGKAPPTRLARRAGHPASELGEEKPPSVLDRYVSQDPASQRLLEQARKVAGTSSTVLIRGESGVGKDHLASVLHFLGENRDEPIVKIDCASLPHELLESELFGYERGAFTGAAHRKRGRMELAGRGTVVLDEIGTLTPAMQAKLLRVLEERTFDRLGGTKPVRLDARIIALTNVDLERAVAQHSFREDLFYRLNVVPLIVPALRERPKDILPLANLFVTQLCDVHRRKRVALSPDASRALERYAFPGNVRELRNVIERAVVLGTSEEITLEDLPAHVRQASTASRRPTLEDLERAYIAEILDYTRGKKSKAAMILGITRKTLLEKRKKYELD
jgi:DNA-binding NtrC family response regulator